MENYCVNISSNKTHSFTLTTLVRIPEDVVWNHPWTCYAYGTALLLENPAQAAPTLERALELFSREGHQIGELMAISSILYFNIIIRGSLKAHDEILHRGEHLFNEHYEKLKPKARAVCAQSISLGFGYSLSDLTKATHYYDIAIKHEGQIDSEFDMWWILPCILINALRGDIQSALNTLLEYLGEVRSAWLAPTTRFSLSIMKANYLLMAGRITEFKMEKDEIQKKWKPFVEASYLGDFLDVWDLDRLTFKGRYSDVIKKTSELRERSIDIVPHIESQLFHYEMLSHAHLGNYESMKKSMRQAFRLRATAGGPFFLHLTRCLTGAALSVAGEYETAKKIWTRIERPFDQEPLYNNPTIYAYRAYANLKEHNKDEVKKDLQIFFAQLRRFNNIYFFGWSPYIMRPVLSYAVENKIEENYARIMAHNVLECDILDNGTVVPLLKFRIINGLTIESEDTQLTEDELTPTWQKLILKLTLTPGHSLEIIKIQSILWPSQDPCETRGKLDTMLSRLRNKLVSKFGKESRHYLCVKGQRLSLMHCQIDLDEALANAKKGLRFINNGANGAASTAFNLMAHWLDLQFDERDSNLKLPESTITTFANALSAWADLLKQTNSPEDALLRVQAAIELTPLNDKLQRQKYDLLTSLKRPGDAALGLKEYRKILMDHDVSKDEVDHVLDTLLMPTNSESFA